MSTKKTGVCRFGFHIEVGKTTVLNRPVFQSPCVYQYCIHSVCVIHVRKRGFQRVQASGLAVGY